MQNVLQAAIIDPALFEAHEFERDQVPADAVLNAADLPGKLAAHDISQGQILRADMLTDKQSIVEDGINASFVIPEGKVAVAFPIDELSSVAYALQAGDSVDLLITVQMIDVDPELQVRLPLPGGRRYRRPEGPGHPAPTHGLPAHAARRAGAEDRAVERAAGANRLGDAGPGRRPARPPAARRIRPAAPANPTIITLVVTQQDALVLKYARESGATIDFALRARDFHEQVTTEPVTLGYMVQRFNVKPPDKLPYAIEGGRRRPRRRRRPSRPRPSRRDEQPGEPTRRRRSEGPARSVNL